MEPVGLPELTVLAAEGWPLPVAARQRLEVHKAVQRERAKAAAKAEAVREGIREAREAARLKREEEQARKEAEKARRRAARALTGEPE